MVVHRTTAEWVQLVEDYKQSGQTMAMWCREHGISAKTLGGHVHGRGAEKKGRSLSEWSILLERQKVSGMSRSAWCKEHGVKADAMTKAESRLKAQEAPIPGPEKLEWVELGAGVAADEEETEPESKPQPKTKAKLEEKTSSAPTLEKREPCFSIKIRSGNVEMEAEGGYPVEKLAYLVERLAKKC